MDRKYDSVFPDKITKGKNIGKYKLIEFTTQTRFRLWSIAKIGNKPLLFDNYKEASDYRDSQ